MTVPHQQKLKIEEKKRRNCLGSTIGLNRGFTPYNPRRAPQCSRHWAIQQCKSYPSKTALSGHINTSLYLPCMQLHSLRMQVVIRVKIKIYRSTKHVTLICCICNFHQLHYFVFHESSNIHFNCLNTQKRALIINWNTEIPFSNLKIYPITVQIIV